MLQSKQYRPLEAEHGIQYLRNGELRVLESIGVMVVKGHKLFDIYTVRLHLEPPMSKSSVGSAFSSLIQLGVVENPFTTTVYGFGYKLVSNYRHAILMDLLKPLEVFWTDKANYRALVELYIETKDREVLINTRFLTGRTKKFRDFLMTIPDLVVVTPKTQYAPQTYAFTNELRLKIRNLLKITAYFNKWRIDGIKIKAPL